MQGQPGTEVTRILERLGAGDSAAADQLLPLVYAELRGIAGRLFQTQPRDHTLQPTALVHEAYVKMLGPDQAGMERLKNRAHFLAVAAQAMRQILVNHAREQHAVKRGGRQAGHRVTLGDIETPNGTQELDVLAIHEQLEALAAFAPRQAHVAELRFFAGLSVAEAAEALDLSTRMVELEWRLAKSWLLARLGGATRHDA